LCEMRARSRAADVRTEQANISNDEEEADAAYLDCIENKTICALIFIIRTSKYLSLNVLIFIIILITNNCFDKKY